MPTEQLQEDHTEEQAIGQLRQSMGMYIPPPLTEAEKEEMRSQADIFLKSSFATDGMTQRDSIMVQMTARDLGIPTSMAHAYLKPVKGHVTIMGRIALALVIASEKYFVRYGKWTHETATCIVVPRDDLKGELVVTFTEEDAKRAQLTGDTYRKYPQDMLMWRAVGRALKFRAGDVLCGLYITEVAQDDARAGNLPERTPENSLEVEAIIEQARAKEAAKPYVATIGEENARELLADHKAACPNMDDATRLTFRECFMNAQGMPCNLHELTEQQGAMMEQWIVEQRAETEPETREGDA